MYQCLNGLIPSRKYSTKAPANKAANNWAPKCDYLPNNITFLSWYFNFLKLKLTANMALELFVY